MFIQPDVVIYISISRRFIDQNVLLILIVTVVEHDRFQLRLDVHIM